MKQNVLIVHNYYQFSGGEGIVVENDARLLREHGHTVFLYTRANDELKTYGIFRKLMLPFTTVFSWKTYREVRRMIREKQIELVHVHNTVPLISPSVYYAAWAEGVPVVQTVHNFRFLCPNGMFFRDGKICEECVQHSLWRCVRHGCYRGSRVQSLVLANAIWLHRLMGTYRRIEALICLTEFNRQKLAVKLPAQRIYVKPNGMSAVDTPDVPLEERKGYCFVGRLDLEKGVMTMLEAFCRIPEETLTIAGIGPAEEQMQTYLQTHKMTNVRMLGQVSHQQACRLMAESKAMLLPTLLYEGMPMTILESCRAGTPVIGSDSGNVGQILRDCGCGSTFTTGSADALQNAVAELTDAQWENLHAKALQTARQWPDDAQNYQSLVQIYARAERQKREKRA